MINPYPNPRRQVTGASDQRVADLMREARRIVRADRALTAAQAEHAARKRAVLADLLSRGVTHRSTAALLGLSRQRVTQYAKEMRVPDDRPNWRDLNPGQ